MSFTQETSSTINIFISSADEDTQLMLELERHLSSLVRTGTVVIFHRHKIPIGEDQEKKINEHLASAHIILLLISANFIASDYCFSIEIKQALERHEAGNVHIIPVLLRPVIWGKMRFSRLQSLPRNGKPITAWFNRDKAFFDVSCDIEKAIEEISKSKQIIISPTSNDPLDNYQKINLSSTHQLVPSQENLTELKQSTDRKSIVACKAAIQEISQQLAGVNLRNIHHQDFHTLKKKLSDVNEQITYIKNKKRIELLTKSIDIINSYMEESAIEIEVFTSIFEKILLEIDKARNEKINVNKLEEGVKDFYKSLNSCCNALDTALQQFLNEATYYQ